MRAACCRGPPAGHFGCIQGLLHVTRAQPLPGSCPLFPEKGGGGRAPTSRPSRPPAARSSSLSLLGGKIRAVLPARSTAGVCPLWGALPPALRTPLLGPGSWQGPRTFKGRGIPGRGSVVGLALGPTGLCPCCTMILIVPQMSMRWWDRGGGAWAARTGAAAGWVLVVHSNRRHLRTFHRTPGPGTSLDSVGPPTEPIRPERAERGPRGFSAERSTGKGLGREGRKEGGGEETEGRSWAHRNLLCTRGPTL